MLAEEWLEVIDLHRAQAGTVHEDQPAGEIEYLDAVGAAFQNAAQERFAFAELHLGAALLGNVLRDADHARRRLVVAIENTRARCNPAPFAGIRFQPEDSIVIGILLAHVAQFLADGAAVVGMNESEKCIPIMRFGERRGQSLHDAAVPSPSA